jgi:hypothetical protein
LLLPIAEELDVALGHRFAGDRIGHVVERLVLQRLLDDRRVGEPHDDAMRVAALHRGGHEIGARLLQRCGDRDTAVEVVLAGLQIELPLRRLGCEVLILSFRDQAVAKVLDVELLPLQLSRVALEVFLDVAKKLRQLDRPSGKRDALTVAEAVVDGRAFAGRLRDDRL